MPEPMRTKPVSNAQVRSYAGKAEEFATAAASEIEAGRYIAATSLALHAATTRPTLFAARAWEGERPARITIRFLCY